MADPFSLAGASMLATAVGGGITAAGQYSKGQSDASMYGYQAGMARTNAAIAKQNSDYALNAGEIQQRQSGAKTQFDRSRALTAQSGSNLDVNFGSAQDVRDSITSVGRQDQDTIRENAARKAYGYRIEGANQENQAAMYDAAGANAKKSGTINAIGTLIGTAGSVAGKWYQASAAGIGSGRGTIDLYGPDFQKTGTY